LIVKETLWKKDLKFIKGVPVICVNYFIIEVTDSEKKIGGIAFEPTFVGCRSGDGI
jgi:hypothetical protein